MTTPFFSPWQQHSRKTVYDNPWIEVSHHEVTTPAGEPGIYGVVHFKNHAVGILPIDNKGYIWLVRQFRYPLNESTWEIPEGGSPEGEDLLTTAKRELAEETGLQASRWQPWLEMDLSNSVTDERGTVFLAQDLIEGRAQPEATEDITIRRLPPSEAFAMVQRGEIRDSLSVAALLKLELALAKGSLTL